MSNAAAAYYAYLALVDRDRARVFRNFGYFASAEHVERRAERYEAMSDREMRGAAPMTDAAPTSPGMNEPFSDLHTTSDG
jgi:hypothetical protein